MRGVPLPREKLCLPFSGSVAQNAICLGDVDGDGANELVVGNSAGDVAVFKGGGVWRRCQGLGHVTAVCVGDLTSRGGRNSLVVVCDDGWCYMFDCCRNDLTAENKDSCDDGGERRDSLAKSADENQDGAVTESKSGDCDAQDKDAAAPPEDQDLLKPFMK